MLRDDGLGPQGLDVVGPEDDDWRPAAGERCCGTCALLREDADGMTCSLKPEQAIGHRWWGCACVVWTGPNSIPVTL